MTVYAASFSGRPAYSLRLEVTLHSQEVANNRSRFSLRLFLRHDTSASNGTYVLDNRPWSLNIGSGGWTKSGSFPFKMGPSGDYVGKEITIWSGISGWINHEEDGTLTLHVTATHNLSDTIVGTATLSGNFAVTQILRAPGAPTFNSISGIKPTSFQANFTAPSEIGGGTITEYTVRYSTSADFSGTVFTETGASSPITCNNGPLAPSTSYYAQVRATNEYGDGPWSSSLSFTTAAAGAPHLGVVPRWDGAGFFLILTPPFSVGSVDDYTIYRTVTGPNAPAPSHWDDADGSYFDSLVLLPGQTVTYQALATVSGVETGLSPSVSLSYDSIVAAAPFWPIFDGSFAPPAPFADQDTAWLGTTNQSMSVLTGSHPKGWRTFEEGAGDPAIAAGVVTRVNKALALQTTTGSFDVMAIFGSVQEEAGVRIGTAVSGAGLAEAFPTVTYFGSILVMSDVETIMACELEFYTSTGAFIERFAGPSTTMTAGAIVELRVSAIALDNTAFVAVTSVDVDGTGWNPGSLRFCGAAQVSASSRYPLFDGDTPSDPFYSYEWMDDPNASPSIRIALSDGASDALQDPDDDPLPAPPSAPPVEEGTVLTDIVWRRYVVAIPSSDVREWIASVPTLSIHAGDEIAREVRLRYWRNPAEIEPDIWTDSDSTVEAEQVISYIPANSTFTIDGVAERAFVVFDSGDSAGQELAADHLLYGEGGGPATWPVLDCGVAYILTLDVPVDATPGNLEPLLALTDRMM